METGHSRFGMRQVATLVAGTGGAQALALAALPVLTRLYGPEELGVLAFFASGAMLAGVVVCGRYELGIPIPDEDEEARHLTRLATTIGLMSSAGLAVLVLTVVHGTSLVSANSIVRFSVWIPLSLALTSMYQPLSYWFTRKRRFRALALSRTLQSGAASVIQVLLGLWAHAGPRSLIAGALAGQAVATLSLEVATCVGERLSLRSRVGIHGLRTLAGRYRDFPRFTTGSSLLQLASDHLPIVVIPVLFDTTVAGIYALPARILQAAIILLSATTAQAFYPHAVREHRAGSLAGTSTRLHRTLLQWTVTPVLLVAVVAPDLFGWAFGSTWRPSGTYFRVLMPWFLTAVPLVPLSQIFLVLGRQRQALQFQSVLLLVVLVTLTGGARWLAPGWAVFAFAMAGGLVRLATIEWLMRATGARRWESVSVAFAELTRSIPYLVLPAATTILGIAPAVSIALVAALIGIHVTVRARDFLRGERTG